MLWHRRASAVTLEREPVCAQMLDASDVAYADRMELLDGLGLVGTAAEEYISLFAAEGPVVAPQRLLRMCLRRQVARKRRDCVLRLCHDG